MEYLTALSLICITFLTYVVLTNKHQQKLIDKLMAKDYQEYKREARADEQQAAQLEIEKQFPLIEEEMDKDYL